MYIPPKQPFVNAIVPVTEPNIWQNKWSDFSDIKSGFAFIAAEVISEGESNKTSFPSIWHRALYKLTIPGPDKILSTATCPNCLCNRVQISISKLEFGAKSECPPCAGSGTHPLDEFIKPHVPKPVPGPITNLTLSGWIAPLLITITSLLLSVVVASACAEKSLIQLTWILFNAEETLALLIVQLLFAGLKISKWVVPAEAIHAEIIWASLIEERYDLIASWTVSNFEHWSVFMLINSDSPGTRRANLAFVPPISPTKL